MKNLKLLTPSNIFLFPQTGEEKHLCCPLKVFLSFLATQNTNSIPKFSFVSAHPSLFAQLSLRENILLDSALGSLLNPDQINLCTFIQKMNNPYLLHLYESITHINEPSSKVDYQTQKRVTLLKAFLQNTPYLLLDHPEKYLDQNYLDILTNLIDFYTSSGKATILLSSSHTSLWRNYANAVVYQNPDKSFQIQPLNKKTNPYSVVLENKLVNKVS